MMLTTKNRIALLFPGQGAQDFMMLKKVSYLPAFKHRYSIICDLLGKDPLKEATTTRRFLDSNRVSSLFTILVSTLSLDLWRNQNSFSQEAMSAYAGYSVGQWTALYAAGVISVEELFFIVDTRSQCMDRAIADNPSGMIAVIGLDEKTVEKICAELREATNLYVGVSNYNAVGQYTLAASYPLLPLLEERLLALSPKKCQRLSVAGGWHSPLLAAAAKEFRSFLSPLVDARIKVNTPQIIVDNTTGGRLPQELEVLKDNLAAHICEPVRWEAGIRYLVSQGVNRFIEIGYGNLLTKFGFFIDRRVSHSHFYSNEPEEILAGVN